MVIRKKRTKAAKPATEAQKKARERNWNKGQILAIRTIAYNILQSKTTKPSEKLDLTAITTVLNQILLDWNK